MTVSDREGMKNTAVVKHFITLRALAAAQCIVIGPVCGCVSESVTMITRNCVH